MARERGADAAALHAQARQLAALSFTGYVVSEYTALDLVENVRTMLAARDVGLVAWQWLRELDATMPRDTRLLFDGLDAGFGRTPGDLERRRDGVGGLLSLVSERGDELVNLRLKILLRDDIWRAVQLPNKSHFYSRDARLSWANQTDYLKVIVKQALRVREVADPVGQRMPDIGPAALSPAAGVRRARPAVRRATGDRADAVPGR
ncbi:hypothetical protein [Frankia gtarii]|uniref:hypothetical protein n=1 Tax=Frankia gtarii TaxID=2950102 RepID=UPI0021C0B800|nr:hypothetical protein [Frankia gtarii]